MTKLIKILMALFLLFFAGNALAEQSLFEQAEQGVPEAQYKLAQSYHYGTVDVEQNFDEALKWYNKAADQNFAQGTR